MKISFFLILFSFPLLANPIEDFPDPYPKVYESVDLLLEDFDQWPLGWYIPAGQLKALFAKREVRIAVEIGVWKGKCTVFLAHQMAHGGKIYAVDHWLGSKEQQDPKNPFYSSLPNLFRQFLSNVIHQRLTDVIIPVRMNSLAAAKKFKELNIRPDLIYLDATQDYISVTRDLKAWFPLLQEGGVICGADRSERRAGGGPVKDVAKALKDFAEKNQLKLVAEGIFWRYEKN